MIETLRGGYLTRLLQGVVAGAVFTMIIGFSWGGWVTGGTAEKMRAAAVEEAIVAVYAPVCAERFVSGATPEQRAAFLNLASWQRDTFVENTGFANLPDTRSAHSGVGDKCASLIGKALEKATEAKKS